MKQVTRRRSKGMPEEPVVLGESKGRASALHAYGHHRTSL